MNSLIEGLKKIDATNARIKMSLERNIARIIRVFVAINKYNIYD